MAISLPTLSCIELHEGATGAHVRPRPSVSKLQLPGGSRVPPALPSLCGLQLDAAGGGGIGGLQGDGRRSGHLRRGGGSAPYCVAARAELCGAEQVRVGVSWGVEMGYRRGHGGE